MALSAGMIILVGLSFMVAGLIGFVVGIPMFLFGALLLGFGLILGLFTIFYRGGRGVVRRIRR